MKGNGWSVNGYKAEDESTSLTHYGVKGMKWKNHKYADSIKDYISDKKKKKDWEKYSESYHKEQDKYDERCHELSAKAKAIDEDLRSINREIKNGNVSEDLLEERERLSKLAKEAWKEYDRVYWEKVAKQRVFFERLETEYQGLPYNPNVNR